MGYTNADGTVLSFFVCAQNDVLYLQSTPLQSFGNIFQKGCSISFRNVAENENASIRWGFARNISFSFRLALIGHHQVLLSFRGNFNEPLRSFLDAELIVSSIEKPLMIAIDDLVISSRPGKLLYTSEYIL